MAARSYFGKPAKELTLEEGALLAGLTKGPNYFNPDRHPGRAQERLAYVLEPHAGGRRHRRGADQAGRGLPALPALVAYERPRRDIGFHFVDQVGARGQDRWPASRRSPPTPTRCARPSTRNCSARSETTLQEGLSRYERSAGRVQFVSPEAKLAKAVQRARGGARSRPTSGRPGSRRSRARGCRSTTCTGRPRSWWRSRRGKKGEAWRVGLADGRILPLSIDNAAAQRKLALYDVVLVRVTDGKGKAGARAELRVRPVVQGAAVVLENKTGRILAMSRRLLLSAEPAQPHDPGACASPARRSSR